MYLRASSEPHYSLCISTKEAVRSVAESIVNVFSPSKSSFIAPTQSTISTRFLTVLLSFAVLHMGVGFVSVAQADERPAEAVTLLADMSKALREKDYRGIFTYEFGGVLQTLRITHRVMGGEEYENVEFLSGPSRRVERNGREVECLSAADQVLRGLLPGLDGDTEAGYAGLQQSYQFFLRDEERLAGRTATVMQIVPRDEYRYGYVFSIDQQTALPLGAMTMAPNRKMLERVQFASLELTPDDSWVGTVGTAAEVKRSEVKPCGTGTETLSWTLGWVPSGFVAAGSSQQGDAGEMQLFTDGLAAFSVFLEPLGKSVAAQGKAQRGATVAYMQQHVFNGIAYTVTVVGEIPAVTAQRIAGSLHWRADADERP